MTLQDLWYSRHWLSRLLLPVALLYGVVITLRRWLYQRGILQRSSVPVPVIVVGNITVGGTGKTPLVIWLVDALRKRGMHPGVVSRGYGGTSAHWPREVTPDSDPLEVGDEAVLISRRCHCPVTVAPRRHAAAQQLISQHRCDVIVADDGLQHYALKRDLEIAVIDGNRGLGNGWLLPAGPLRESAARLNSVDIVVSRDQQTQDQTPGMVVSALGFRRLDDPDVYRPLDTFAGQSVHAVAGIGYPQRFFATLAGLDATVIEHAFPDHHHFCREDIAYGDSRPIVMTEKDAVKCYPFASPDMWYLEVAASVNAAFCDALNDRLDVITGEPAQEPPP